MVLISLLLRVLVLFIYCGLPISYSGVFEVTFTDSANSIFSFLLYTPSISVGLPFFDCRFVELAFYGPLICTSGPLGNAPAVIICYWLVKAAEDEACGLLLELPDTIKD